jgi:2-dehydropantoate 2-reductase
MKVCVYGAGAVGGHVAARLADAGHAEVSVVARGAQLAAIRQRGLVLRNDAGEVWHAAINSATDQPENLPPQDLVLVALKATALPSHAQALDRLLAPGGVAVFLNNGIPWWWTASQQGGGHALPLLDPEGRLWNTLRPERALGAVVYSSNEIELPGVVINRGSARNRFIFGAPLPADAGQAAKLRQIVALFQDSGMPGEIAADLRQTIWVKLLLNAAGNPVSALTRLGTLDRGQDAGLQQLSISVATEVATIARAMGWTLPPEAVADAVSVGKAQNMRPSMLQDVLAGRPMEIEALLGQPQQFAREHGIATPAIDVLLPLLRGLDRGIQLASAA